jgi:hypothetical protein
MATLEDRSPTDLSYTLDELRSYLPSGWNLAAGEPGEWDPAGQAFRLTVVDDVEFDWPIEVGLADARRHGRLEALRRAFNRTQRERLGRPTRGLGWARLRR